MKLRFAGLLLAAASCWPCLADDGCCCPQCGGTNCLRKVCRIVPFVKKEKQTKYRVQCEEICLPGHSKPCNSDGDHCWDRCCLCRSHAWEPTCDGVITRKFLVKETVTVERPGCRCVVETVCSQCGCTCAP